MGCYSCFFWLGFGSGFGIVGLFLAWVKWVLVYTVGLLLYLGFRGLRVDCWGFYLGLNLSLVELVLLVGLLWFGLA